MIATQKHLLYENVLKWAHEKGASGFSEEELFQELKVDRNWYLKTFRPDDGAHLVTHLRYDDKNNVHFYTLSSKGISEYGRINKPWHETAAGKIIIGVATLLVGTIILNLLK